MKTGQCAIPKHAIMALFIENKMGAGLSGAIFIAASALGLKTTWNGTDYAEHWLTVADIANPDRSESEKIVGVLHDVPEDSDLTLDDLRTLGFSNDIVNGVDSVTKRPGEKYLDATCRAAANDLGRPVKKRDNKHNMDLTRSFKTPTAKQKFLYPISYSFLDAVEKKHIPATTPMWDFLNMPRYQNLLDETNFRDVAKQISAPIPEQLLRKFALLPA